MFALVVVLSVVVGVSLGLLGGGGSILTLPLLRYGLGMEAHSAVALSLLVVGTTSAAALIPHALKGRVRWRTGALFGVAGMTGAYLAGRLAHLIPAPVLLIAFGVMMFVTAFAMLRGRKATPHGQPLTAELPVVKVLAEGLVVGAVTGLVGAGGGFLVVPALVLLGGLPMNIAVGTSLLVIAMKSFAGFAGFAGHTPIDYSVGAWISAAAVVGSFGGSALVHRVPPKLLRRGFAWFVVAMALFLFAQELPPLFGASWSIARATLTSLVGTGALWLVSKLVTLRSSTNREPSPSSTSAVSQGGFVNSPLRHGPQAQARRRPDPRDAGPLGALRPWSNRARRAKRLGFGAFHRAAPSRGYAAHKPLARRMHTN